MLPYALSIFIGAFLLFQVQPLIAKYILPWFGGSPGVWTTCMLFFQLLLLGGYAYAHFSTTRLSPRKQATLHLVLLVISLALLPIIPSEAWKTRIAGDPIFNILMLLGVCVGLPYFVLSATGPLMQQWFTQTNPGVSPYRLYALSNIGSLLALLTYPVFFERYLTRHAQAWLWSGSLVVFAICCGYCALKIRKASSGITPAVPDKVPVRSAMPAGLDKFLWLALPAAASMLLLATTNKLCQEVAVIPFLWVLPLSIYLVTFIISFDAARWYVRPVYVGLLMISIAAACFALYQGNSMPFMQQITVYCCALFLGCMVCHGELYRLRPPAEHLTSFYLHISAGGAIGGIIVAIGAPLLFKGIWELQVSLWLLSYLLGVLCFRLESRGIAWAAAIGALGGTIVVPILRGLRRVSDGYWAEEKLFYIQNWKFVAFTAVAFLFCVVFKIWRPRLRREWGPGAGIFVMFCSVITGIILVIQIRGDDDKGPDADSRLVSVSRNFYGTLKVFEYNFKDADPVAHYFLLLNGATTHGMQFTESPQNTWPTTYYGESSGVGLAIKNFPKKEGGFRLGIVGLGTGSLTTYGKKGDHVTVYDINPAVKALAETRFSYLALCQADLQVVMGDARLSMERQLAEGHSQQFDVLALDAFSSDAIPVHLLTKESFEIYIKHLAPDGVIAVHTSNRNLDLRPVVENLAKEFGMEAATIADDSASQWWVYRTTWILVTKNKALLDIDAIKSVTDGPAEIQRDVGLWTDDYTSLYGILK